MRPPRSDQNGLTQLYRELRGELLRFLSVRLGDEGQAEEVIQELYLRIHQSGSGPIGNPRAYLYRSAQNLALDRIRERRRRIARDAQWFVTQHPEGIGAEVVDEQADAEGALLEREQVAALSSALASLPEKAGRVLHLHKFEGVSHAEIARRLGISRSGVEKHIALAMAHLRRRLRD